MGRTLHACYTAAVDVVYHPDTETELDLLPPAERAAMLHAVEKLDAIGDQLPFPHSSGVKGTQLRELRPRGGRSPWRAIYRRVGRLMVVLAIAPEAQRDKAGFDRAVRTAEDRLTALRDEGNEP